MKVSVCAVADADYVFKIAHNRTQSKAVSHPDELNNREYRN